jgi:hypothetical protein
MRKVVLLAVLPLAVAPLLPAATAAAQAPVGDSVVGSGRDCFVDDTCTPVPADSTFVVDARSGPAGENPTGEASYSTGFGFARTLVSGRVVCMSVNGNVAVVGIVGRVVAPGLGIDIPASAVITVRDQGGEASGLDRFSPTLLFSTSPPFEPPPPNCSSVPAQGGFANERGDLVVRDTTLPTITDQCKNSGWKSYGVFKNQGDCLSFVATGGKNPPAGG